VPLSGLTRADTGSVGTKAAVLGELRGAGFAVPDGFVLRTGAQGDAGGHAFGGVPVPAAIRAELADALEALGGGPVAVRSSGVAEDLADRSFAGQYESVLNVRGVDELVDAVRRCWASASAERVAAYRGGPVETVRAGLGVLVQVMVPAESAGVAFSVNPVTGADEVVLSAVRGLGDRLLAGECTGDEWVVRGGRAERTAGEEHALTGDQARQIAELTSRVARYFGTPQDVEWAVVDGEIRLLQARPVTGLPAADVPEIPVAIDVPPGFWSRDRNTRRPWVPAQRSVFLPVFARACRHVFAFTTGSAPQVREIGGWPYLSLPPDSPRDRIARLERIAGRVAVGEPLALVNRWHNEWKPVFARRIARLRAVELRRLNDEGLAAHLGDLVRLFGELHEVYFRLSGAAIALLGELGVTCAELLDWPPERVLALRGGLTGDHMPAATGLGRLAELLREVGDEDDSRFVAAFAGYVDEYGHRTVGFDLTEPTLAEQPGLLLALVRAQRDRPYDFAAERDALLLRQSTALVAAREILAGRDADERERFERAFAASEASGPVRDEKVFYAVSLWALLRYALLDLGRRLAERGSTDRVDDVFFVELDDALEALRGGQHPREAVSLARGRHAWALAHPGPPSYGEPPTPATGSDDPSAADEPVSAAAARVGAVGRFWMGLWGGGVGTRPEDGSLVGVAASAGRYTGPVRVLLTIADFAKLRPGDVLVCPETTAQWAVLFPSVGAVVTDNGSLLSHPAILAREYGVPAVVATREASRTFRDGEVVTVDGSTGIVYPRREHH
jgi:pyruvate,water dikinase